MDIGGAVRGVWRTPRVPLKPTPKKRKEADGGTKERGG
jgi:hypothetical protein